jgi:hypothetical protein
MTFDFQHLLQSSALAIGLYLVIRSAPSYLGELSDQLMGRPCAKLDEYATKIRRDMAIGMMFILVLVLFPRL